MDRTSLEICLAKALPKDAPFTLHHVSTPPKECSAIFAASPGQGADKTYCESQFLSVSIQHEDRLLQVFAIEVLIYTTDHLTTLFISKADSTGCLHLLALPKGTPSPLKTLATGFLQFLISERTRPDRRLVLSLFARAQNQYLFPGSVENTNKHVLDDRGLIKWWCRVVQVILTQDRTEDVSKGGLRTTEGDASKVGHSQGYLRVPGYDVYGTKTFFPRDSTGGPNANAQWKVADPLRELAQSTVLPERCLIPRFPDDPKARYVEALDEELPDEETGDSRSPSTKRSSDAGAGRWRSIRSLEEFWEAMSFRQECSSGRLVGFLWAVFTPANMTHSGVNDAISPAVSPDPSLALPAPFDSHTREASQKSAEPSPFPKAVLGRAQTPPPTSPARLEPPTSTPVKTLAIETTKMQPESTPHYYWPVSSRGEVVLGQRDYDRVGRMLLRLDYANEAVAAESTGTWIEDVAKKACVTKWGRTVFGERSVNPADQPAIKGDDGVALIGAGVVRKKKRPADCALQPDETEALSVNDLAATLVRKKPKANGAVKASEAAAEKGENSVQRQYLIS